MPLASAALLLFGCQQHQQAPIAGNMPSLQAARDALNEGQASTALAIARGVLSSQPTNVAALSQAGDAEAALGDRPAADADYKKALAIAPRDVRARLGLGKLQLRDNIKAAEMTFRSILLDLPRDPQVLTDLGYTLDMQERHAEAQAVYDQALAVDPGRTATQVDLALSFALSGQGARAEQMLRDIAASSSSTPRVRVDYALAQVIAGHDREAALTLGSDLTPEETNAAIAGMAQLRPEAPPPVK